MSANDDDAPESLRAATSFCAGGRAVDVPAPSRAREGQDDRTTAEWIADLVTARQVAEAEAEQLRAKVARVEALHNLEADEESWCVACGFSWPCETARALADPAPVEQQDDEAKCPTCGKGRGEARTMVRHTEGFGLCPESFHFRDEAGR